MQFQDPSTHVMESSFLLGNEVLIPDGVIGFRILLNEKKTPNFVITGLRGSSYFVGSNSIPAFLSNLRNIPAVENDYLPGATFSVSNHLTLRIQKMQSLQRGDSYRLMVTGPGHFNPGTTLARGKDLDILKVQIDKIADWVERCVRTTIEESEGNESTIESVSSVIKNGYETHLAFHSNKGGEWLGIGKNVCKDGIRFSITSERDVIIFDDDLQQTHFKNLLEGLRTINGLPLTEDNFVKIDINPENNFYVVGKVDSNYGEKTIKINCDDNLYTSSLILRSTPKRFPLLALIVKMLEMLK